MTQMTRMGLGTFPAGEAQRSAAANVIPSILDGMRTNVSQLTL